MFHKSQTHDCNAVSRSQLGGVPALQSPRNSSLTYQSRPVLHAWSWRSALRKYVVFFTAILPSDNECVYVCVLVCAIQTLNVNCAIAHMGWTKGQRLRSRAAAAVRVCFVCAHILVHTVTVDLLMVRNFHKPTRRKRFRQSSQLQCKSCVLSQSQIVGLA